MPLTAGTNPCQVYIMCVTITLGSNRYKMYNDSLHPGINVTATFLGQVEELINASAKFVRKLCLINVCNYICTPNAHEYTSCLFNSSFITMLLSLLV